MALPEPDDGLTVNQAAFDDTDQDVFDVTDTEVDPAEDDATAQLDTPTVRDGVALAPGWVTVTVRVTCGEPLVVVKVTVAVRDAVEVLARTVNATAVLPEPEVGLTVNQAAFDDALQVVFDDTETDAPAAEADATDQFVPLKTRVGTAVAPG